MKELNINLIVEIAKSSLKENGFVANHCIYFENSNLTYLDFQNSSEEYFAEAQELILKCGVKRYFHVSETWLVESKKNIFCRPSEHPDKKEALLIEKFNKDMTQKTIIIPFERKEGKFIFLELQKMEDPQSMSSKYNFYVESSSHAEKINYFRKRMQKGVD